MNDGSSVSGFYQDVNVVVPNELLMFVQSLLTTYSTCRAFFSKRGRLIAILDYILLPSNDQRSSFSYFFFYFSLFFFFFCSFFLLGESISFCYFISTIKWLSSIPFSSFLFAFVTVLGTWPNYTIFKQCLVDANLLSIVYTYTVQFIEEILRRLNPTKFAPLRFHRAFEVTIILDYSWYNWTRYHLFGIICAECHWN